MTIEIWDVALEKAAWVIVHSEGDEYKGWLAAYGTHEQKKDIVLGQPRLITRNDDGTEDKKITLGKSIIIPEEKIDKIVIINYVDTRLDKILKWLQK